MKKIIFILVLFISFSSCKSSKRSKRSSNSSSKIITKKSQEYEKGRVVISSEEKNYTPRTTNSRRTKADNIIEYAESFEGVRYKWGGTTKAGMDCSGLIYESFRAYDVNLRDLLFFKTGNRRNAINHVGLIVSIENNDIEFIHATSSKGVMTSWINETYWNKAFYEARRIL